MASSLQLLIKMKYKSIRISSSQAEESHLMMQRPFQPNRLPSFQTHAPVLLLGL